MTTVRWPRTETLRIDGLLIRRTISGYKVLSSTNKDHWYDMGDGTRCQCEGYFFRQTCKHVKAVQKLIRRSPLLGPRIALEEKRREAREVERRQKGGSVI